MMNRLLVLARNIKGVGEEELAAVLDIGVLQYRAIESLQAPVTPELARKLAAYYPAPAWYFLEPARRLELGDRIDQLRRQHEIISKPDYRSVPPGASVALATTILELMISREELSRSLLRELELSEQLVVMKRMYDYLALVPEAGGDLT